MCDSLSNDRCARDGFVDAGYDDKKVLDFSVNVEYYCCVTDSMLSTFVDPLFNKLRKCAPALKMLFIFLEQE